MERILNQAIINAHKEHLKIMIKVIKKKYGKDYNINISEMKQFIDTIKYSFSSSQEKLVRKKITRKTVPECDRCEARSWGEGIIKHKGKKIKGFKPNKINAHTDNEYGVGCKNRKVKGEKYCNIHLNKLCHGNMKSQPSTLVKGFYIKHNQKNLSTTLKTKK